MQVVQPFEITPAAMIDTNVPEDDYPEYDPVTTYNIGDRVIVLSTRSVYESTSVTPFDDIDPTSPEGVVVWLRIGAINRWRAFDKIVGTVTSGKYGFDPELYNIDTLDPEFDPLDAISEGVSFQLRTTDVSDSLSLFNLTGLYVDVIVRTTDGVVYYRRINLGGTISQSLWYSYFYEPLYRLDRVVLTDLPETPEKDIYISIVESTEDVDPEIGEIVVGRLITLGKALYGTSLNFIDFSTKERDEFGNFKIQERAYADDLEVDMSIKNDEIFYLRNILAELRAKPTVYIPSRCIQGTAVYGYVAGFDIVISGPERSDATLLVRGLI